MDLERLGRAIKLTISEIARGVFPLIVIGVIALFGSYLIMHHPGGAVIILPILVFVFLVCINYYCD
jgi:hypothetical protein